MISRYYKPLNCDATWWYVRRWSYISLCSCFVISSTHSLDIVHRVLIPHQAGSAANRKSKFSLRPPCLSGEKYSEKDPFEITI